MIMASAKLTTLGVAVLELLHERPMHPYEMAQLMRERYVENRVKVAAGSLYHTVERLLTGKLIEIVDTQREGRRPERTVYGMTEAGRDAFVERARVMVSVPATEYPEFLSGLAVIDDLGREDAIEQLRHRILRLTATVGADRAAVETLRKNKTPEVYWLDWRFTSARAEFELEWTEQLLADLESGRIPFNRKDNPRSPLNLVPRDREDEQAN
jgi:DNA-binding PadR family transcriptional regulator